jgi:hypothetical protein
MKTIPKDLESIAISWAKKNSELSETDVKSFLLSKAKRVYDDFEYWVISHTGDTEEELYDLAVGVYKKTKAKTEACLKKMRIDNYTINDDLTVDVDGYMRLYDKGLTEIILLPKACCQ